MAFVLMNLAQVVEHIPQPAEFVRKLLSVGHTVVLAVPYRWEPCGGDCHHKNHEITREKIAGWAGRQVRLHMAQCLQSSRPRLSE